MFGIIQKTGNINFHNLRFFIDKTSNGGRRAQWVENTFLCKKQSLFKNYHVLIHCFEGIKYT